LSDCIDNQQDKIQLEYDDTNDSIELIEEGKQGVFYSEALSLINICDCTKPTVGELIEGTNYGYKLTVEKIMKKGNATVSSFLHGLLIFIHLGETTNTAVESLLYFATHASSKDLPQQTMDQYSYVCDHFNPIIPSIELLQTYIKQWTNFCKCLQKEMILNEYVVSLDLTGIPIARGNLKDALLQLRRNMERAASLLIKAPNAKWITTKNLIIGDSIIGTT
jgi:hypothetical protein